MKINKILLFALGGVVVALIITGLLLLRNDVATLAEKDQEYQFTEVGVASAERFYINGMWDIRLHQGRKFKLEVISETQSDDTRWSTNEEVLEFHHGVKDTCRVRLTVPILKEVIAENNAILKFNRFEGDTLRITLGEGVAMIDNNSRFKCVELNTKGNTSIKTLNTDF